MSENLEIAEILKRFEAKETNSQLHILADKLSELAASVAVRNERDDHWLERLRSLEDKVSKVATKVDTIEDMANKWRGAFIVLMGLGGAGGAIMAYWDRFSKWVHP